MAELLERHRVGKLIMKLRTGVTPELALRSALKKKGPAGCGAMEAMFHGTNALMIGPSEV